MGCTQREKKIIENSSQTCPLCNSQDETFSHFLHCQSRNIPKLKQTFLSSLTKLHMPPPLITSLSRIVFFPIQIKHDFKDLPIIQAAINNQNTIGFDHLIQGRISKMGNRAKTLHNKRARPCAPDKQVEGANNIGPMDNTERNLDVTQ